MEEFKNFRIANLAFGGQRCRIDWFGAVTFAERYLRSSQPLMEVQVSQIPEDISDFNSLFPQADTARLQARQIRLPVSFLPMLKIGDVWRDGWLVGDFG